MAHINIKIWSISSWVAKTSGYNWLSIILFLIKRSFCGTQRTIVLVWATCSFNSFFMLIFIADEIPLIFSKETYHSVHGPPCSSHSMIGRLLYLGGLDEMISFHWTMSERTCFTQSPSITWSIHHPHPAHRIVIYLPDKEMT